MMNAAENHEVMVFTELNDNELEQVTGGDWLSGPAMLPLTLMRGQEVRDRCKNTF